MKNHYLSSISLLALAPALCSSEASAQGSKNPEQPNIIVILCDDLGNGDLSSFGHPIIKTPNLDQMAEDGIRLTNCYSAAPVSSASRAGLITGRNPNKAGIYRALISGSKQLEDCLDMAHLQSHEQTIPMMLKNAGYATCLSGKWHCTTRFNSDEQPQPDHFGFDHWFATHNNAAPSHENPKNFVRNGKKAGQLEGFSCQIVINEALSWLDGRKKKDNPFYLQICFHEPHTPIESPRELVDKYLPMSKDENQAQFFANVENMDSAVGRLIEYLKANNVDNTLIYFTSDNGPETLNRYKGTNRSHGTTGGLKGMKLWTNEGGFHVPGIIYTLGIDIHKGQSDAIISALDLMPTFAELSGAKLPDVILDGESFTELLKKGDKKRKKPLIWAYYSATNKQALAMRTQEWKIMCRLKNNGEYLPNMKNLYDGNEQLVKDAELVDFELYHISKDRNETTEVSAKYPKELNQMKKLLKKEYAALLKESHIWKRE